MSPNLIAIPAAFVVLMSILLWFIIGSKGHWILKFFSTILALSFSFFIWSSFSDIAGYSASGIPLPDKFQVYWMIVEEPSHTDKEGAIYLWVSPLNEFNIPIKEEETFSLVRQKGPRTYALPYTREMHEQSQEVIKKLKAGKKVVGQGKNDGEMDGDGDGKEGGEGKGSSKNKSKKRGKGRSGFSFSMETDFMFYELPPPKIPEKILSE